jgi:GNAT superfamily N-acetyltransferase
MSSVRTFARKLLSVYPADIWSADLTAEPPPLPETGFELRSITSPEDPLLDRLGDDTFDRVYYRACLARGDRGYAAMDGETCAGRTWLTTMSHRDPWSGQRVRLDPGEVWSFGSWVEPRYRRLGVISFLLTCNMRELHRDGFTRLYGAAESANVGIQTVIIPMGFTRGEHVVFVRILNRVGVQVPFSVQPRTGPAAPRRHRPNVTPYER